METITTKIMTRNYALALGLVAILALAAFGLLELVIATQETSAKAINVSGRQRMLSQRIALYSMRLVDAPPGPEQESLRRDLRDMIDLMALSHRRLRQGSAGSGLPEPSDEVRKLFDDPPNELDNQIKRYLNHARNVVDAPTDLLDKENPDLKAVIAQASGVLLVSLDRVVGQYEIESESAIENLELLIGVLIAIILIVLFGEARLVFKPLVSKIGEQTEELQNNYRQARDIAVILQEGLMPSQPPEIDGLAFNHTYESATVAASIGGDFFDYYKNADGTWSIILGDVAGHGIEAATEIARVKYLLRDRATSGLKPTDIVSSVNKSLGEQDVERFTALTYLNYDNSTGKMSIVAAGNPFPYLVAQDRFIEIAGIPLSIDADEQYEAFSIMMAPGETLIIYSDGLSEARVGTSLFGAERMQESFRANAALPPDEMLGNIVNEARAFAQGHLSDDLLVISLTRRPERP